MGTDNNESIMFKKADTTVPVRNRHAYSLLYPHHNLLLRYMNVVWHNDKLIQNYFRKVQHFIKTDFINYAKKITNFTLEINTLKLYTQPRVKTIE
jgi:hypothetical protein